MAEAVSNTSPLFYLHQIGALDWLERLFTEVWTTEAVVQELSAGSAQGCKVPSVSGHAWLKIVEARRIPSEWLAPDLGAGELSALALALDHPSRIVLLDDALARRVAQAAGLTVWGTLRVLLESKKLGLTSEVAPLLDGLEAAGMWVSLDVRQRCLKLAGEAK